MVGIVLRGINEDFEGKAPDIGAFEFSRRSRSVRKLARLYRGLWSSEHGHYLVFIDMARLVQPAGVVHHRWDEMLDRLRIAGRLKSYPAAPPMRMEINTATPSIWYLLGTETIS